jgi:uncharacterized membrane protein YeaQ/YmgE (transglycosylase-associated protein family)
MLWSFIIGLVAGWIANIAVRGGGYGLIANLIVGLIGSLLGCWIVQKLSFAPLSAWGVVLSSTIGAAILLILVSIMAKEAKKR